MDRKNQYGRKTWDVDAYAKVAKERRSRGNKRVGDRISSGSVAVSTEDILRQANAVGNEEYFGEENSWFVCKLCNRRFKDSLRLSEHLSSKQHLENLAKYKKARQNRKEREGGGEDGEVEITLENVKKHLQDLAKELKA